jgi:cell division protein FtsB
LSQALCRIVTGQRRILDALTALTQRVETLEAEKNVIRAENAELRTGLSLLLEWAKTLTLTNGSPGASG